MANPEHLKILKRGVDVWNKWREVNHASTPDLSGAYLRGEDLIGANLRLAILDGADLHHADLRNADLMYARLAKADLRFAYLNNARLFQADIKGALLYNSILYFTDLQGADLQGADLSGVRLAFTSFGDNDLSGVKGLDSVTHQSPSTVGIDTIYKSQGNIPEEFLLGCGVPEDFITYMRSLVVRPIQFYSCFISYSTKDEEFARRLYSRMRDASLRVWFAPEEMKGGEKLFEQIDRAIQVHDKLLLILSEHSMESEWVLTEVRRARETEAREGRRKLFPISIVEFEKIKAWRRFDADTGRDLAAEVRSYFIPDFSRWKDHDAFEAAFERLLRDLKAEEKVSGSS